MFRWLLIITVLCPCPCQWGGASSVRETAAVARCSCCDSCDAEHQPNDNDSVPPQKRCPRCASTVSAPPSRVSWSPEFDSGVWGVVPVLKVTRNRDRLSSGRAGQVLLYELYHGSPAQGRGLPLQV